MNLTSSRSLPSLLILIGCAFSCFAEGKEGKPVSSNVPNADSPRVFADRNVSFTFKAPEAKDVKLSGGDGLGKGPFAMSKGDNGFWSVTIPNVVPGFHYYWFVVDGVQVNDPGSKTFFGYGRETGGVDVPPESGSEDDGFYDVKDVPHGEVRSRWYKSTVTRGWRRCTVYTPPGYDDDASRSTRYPVLYLQHGAGEDETGWTEQGRINFILDNLLAGLKAKPMLIVMDRGYATAAGGGAAAPPPNTPAARQQGFSAFEQVVIKDLIPMIDASYRTQADREHRALAGLSMGGMQTMFIASHHLDTFAWIGDFSGPIRTGAPGGGPAGAFDVATTFEGLFADAKAFNAKCKLLWMTAGTAEAQIHDALQNASTALKKAGVNVTFYESQGTAHEWQTWRRGAREFLPLLFR
jgi:enterochelin esterase-like enzyme